MILIRYDIDIIHLKLSHLHCRICSRKRILHMNSPFVHTIMKVRGWDYVQFTTWRWWPGGELRTIGEKRYDGNDDPIIIFLLTSSSCGPHDARSQIESRIHDLRWWRSCVAGDEFSLSHDAPPSLKSSRRRARVNLFNYHLATAIRFRVFLSEFRRSRADLRQAATHDEIIAPQTRLIVCAIYENDGESGERDGLSLKRLTRTLVS